ncbi:MAG TPA: porin family protein, partial [Phnomibacter sp.]|nr:porin family protein [Phnomibacter sp.]
MKNKLTILKLLVSALIIFPTIIHAQVSLGAKGGLNFSNLNGLTKDNYKRQGKIGFHLGGYTTFNFGRNFALQPELMYSSQGATIESGNVTEDIKLNYINVPIMIKFLTNNGFYFELGPQVGFRAGD